MSVTDKLLVVLLKSREFISAARTINHSRSHLILWGEEKDPQYRQRKEWVDWMLEEANLLEIAIGEAQKAHEQALAAAPPVVESYPMLEHWRVEVSTSGEQIVAIESAMLAGKSYLTEADQRTIVGCAEHLLSFVGARTERHYLAEFNPDADDKPAQAEIPFGYTLVPLVPTLDMIDAIGGRLSREQYDSLLRAAAVVQQRPARLSEFARGVVHGFDSASAGENLAQALHGAAKSSADAFYVQRRGRYVGNSLVWICPGNSGYTTAIAEAGVFSKDEATRFSRRAPGCTKAWRKADIDRLAVLHVNNEDLMAADVKALGDTP